MSSREEKFLFSRSFGHKIKSTNETSSFIGSKVMHVIQTTPNFSILENTAVTPDYEIG